MSKNIEPTPDKAVHFPKGFSLARTRALKRIIPWLGGVSLVGAGLIAVVAVFAGNGQGFTTKIERGGDLKDVILRDRAGGEAKTDEQGVYYLNATGLANAFPTSAQVILPQIEAAWNDPNVDMNGSYVVKDENDSEIGFAYTFYLDNLSQEEKKNYTFYLSLDAYSAPANYASPYAYMRAVVYMSKEDGSDERHTVFAAPNDLGQGTAEGGIDDTRECISTFSESPDKTIRTPIYKDHGIGYCTNFSGKYEELVRLNETLEPGETRRYTILTYFEGEDPDCKGGFPENAGVTLTAHFGS